MFKKSVVLFLALAALAILLILLSPWGRESKPLRSLPDADSAADGPDEMASLIQKRDQAAIRGMRWMDDFLKQDENFKTMPFESYHFFYVCAQTSTSPRIAQMARKMAAGYEVRLRKHVLKMEEPLDRHVFLQLLELITKHNSGARDDAKIIAMAKRSFAAYGSVSDIYGRDLDGLDQAELIDIFYVLLHAYFLEKADMEYPGDFSVNYRLVDILRYLKTRKLTNFRDAPSDDFSQAVQGVLLATHVAYVMSDYSQLKLYEEDAPWLYAYLRENFAGAIDSGIIDVIAEMVDVFRSLGFTEKNSDIVRTGTAYLLEHQNEDGSWGEVDVGERSAYDNMHPTSSAIWALRDRSFLTGTNYSKRIQNLLRKLNEDHANQ